MKITGSGREGLPKYNLENMFLPLPPLDEQIRIIHELNKLIDLAINIEDNQQDLVESIKQIKTNVLYLAIHGKLVPQDPNDEPAIELLKRINPTFVPCDNSHYENLPFEVPNNWCWVLHNSIFDISGGAQPAKSEFSEELKPGYIRLYQIRDYGEKPAPIYIPISTASKTTKKGEILLARYGGSLGKVFIAEDGAYNVAMAKVIFKYPEIVNKTYAYYYYLSYIYQNKLKSISRTAQAGFNSGDLEDMYFPLPPLNEQVRIIEMISSLWKILDSITAEL
jgi:type I restriction enzyme S subunit